MTLQEKRVMAIEATQRSWEGGIEVEQFPVSLILEKLSYKAVDNAHPAKIVMVVNWCEKKNKKKGESGIMVGPSTLLLLAMFTYCHPDHEVTHVIMRSLAGMVPMKDDGVIDNAGRLFYSTCLIWLRGSGLEQKVTNLWFLDQACKLLHFSRLKQMMVQPKQFNVIVLRVLSCITLTKFLMSCYDINFAMASGDKSEGVLATHHVELQAALKEQSRIVEKCLFGFFVRVLAVQTDVKDNLVPLEVSTSVATPVAKNSRKMKQSQASSAQPKKSRTIEYDKSTTVAFSQDTVQGANLGKLFGSVQDQGLRQALILPITVHYRRFRKD